MPWHHKVGLQALSLLLSTPSHRVSSLFTNGNGYRLTKVGLRVLASFCISPISTLLSATIGGLLHHEQPDLSVPRRLQPCLQSFGLCISCIGEQKRSPYPQLTSLQALQTSLDILRSHRPSYTPRTGFVWPIVESSDPSKRPEETNDGPATQGAESQSQDRELSPSQSKRTKISNARQQNVMLLVNAMRTTALHATESFTLPTTAPFESTPAVPETQTPGAGPGPTPGAMSAAATPAPAPRGATPVGHKRAGSPLDREPTKGQPGAGKKKKRSKSTSSTGESRQHDTE